MLRAPSWCCWGADPTEHGVDRAGDGGTEVPRHTRSDGQTDQGLDRRERAGGCEAVRECKPGAGVRRPRPVRLSIREVLREHRLHFEEGESEAPGGSLSGRAVDESVPLRAAGGEGESTPIGTNGAVEEAALVVVGRGAGSEKLRGSGANS